MAKQPCASCGTLMTVGKQSLPLGQSTCRPCRRLQPRPYSRTARECGFCGVVFVGSDAHGRIQRACSKACGAKIRYRVPAGLTDADIQLERWRRKNRRRRAEDIASEPYTLTEIAERDGYRCGLCRRPVHMSKPYLDPASPTIDHVIPLSISRDDRRVNVQLAHRSCNTAKGAGSANEQLALIG